MTTIRCLTPVTIRRAWCVLLVALGVLLTARRGEATLPEPPNTSSRVECEPPIVREAPGVLVVSPRVGWGPPKQPTVPHGGDALERTIARVQRTPRLAAGLGALLGLLGLSWPMMWWTIREPAARVAWTSAFAFAPFLLSLGAAARIRFAMVESTMQAGYCLPRELMLEIGTFDVFDALILGALASVPLLWVMLGTLVAARQALRKSLVAPTVLASVSVVGTWALWEQLDRDRAALQAPSDYLRQLDVSLPAASTHRGTALPDLPIVTIDEAGTASYADRATGFRRERLPALFRPTNEPSPFDESPPPALIVAVDRRTPFAAVEAALKPLVDRGHGHYELVYADGDERPTIAIDAFSGAKSRAAGERWGALDLHVHVRIDDRGISLIARGTSVAPGCRGPGPGPTLPGNPSPEAIRDCVIALKEGAKPVDLGERVWVLSASNVPFGAVEAVVDVLVTNGLFDDVSIGYDEPLPASALERQLRPITQRGRAMVTQAVTEGHASGVERIFAGARGRLRRCYEEGLGRDASSQGTVDFALVFHQRPDGEGSVMSSEDVTVRPTAGHRLDARVVECVARTLGSLVMTLDTPTVSIDGEIRFERVLLDPSP